MIDINMPNLLLTVNQSDYLIHIIAKNSHTEWQTVQIQIYIYTVCKDGDYVGSAGLEGVDPGWGIYKSVKHQRVSFWGQIYIFFI